MRPLFRTCMTLDAGYRLRRSAHSIFHLVHYSAGSGIGIYTSNENGAWLNTMPYTRAVSQSSSLPLRQNRLEVKPVPSRWRQPVELSQLFAAIPPRDLAEILTASRTMIFTPKQTLFLHRGEDERVILLTEGSVKITQIDEFGSTVILRLVGPVE